MFASLQKAEAVFEGGDAVGAMQLYRDIVEQHPDSKWAPYALYKLAWAEVNLGNVSGGITDMERLVGWFEDESVAMHDSNQRLREAAEADLTQFRSRLGENANPAPE